MQLQFIGKINIIFCFFKKDKTANEITRCWGYLNAVVLSLSHVRHFATPWIAACQASLSFTITQSLVKPMSIESVMPSNHLILCHPFLLLPSVFPRVFSRVSWLFASCGQSIGASVSASVLPMNVQD